MDLLIFALVVVLVVALLIWAIDMAGLPGRINTVCRVVVVAIAIILIVQRAGLF